MLLGVAIGASAEAPNTRLGQLGEWVQSMSLWGLQTGITACVQFTDCLAVAEPSKVGLPGQSTLTASTACVWTHSQYLGCK